MSIDEACAAFDTDDAAKLIDRKFEPDAQCISSSEMFAFNQDQSKSRRNQRDTAMEAIFINQADHSVPYKREALQEDPLLVTAPTHSKQKQCFSKNLKELAFCESYESSDKLHEICNKDPPIAQHPSCPRIILYNSLNHCSLRQISLKHKSMKRSRLKGSVDNGEPKHQSPESFLKSAEHTNFSEKKFMDQISLARNASKSASIQQVVPKCQLPIVSLISVKRTKFKKMKIVKEILPNLSSIKDTPSGLKRQAMDVVQSKIKPKKATQLKKATSKKYFSSEIHSTQQPVSKQKTVAHNSQKKKPLKKNTTKNVSQPKKYLKPKAPQPKATKQKPQLPKSEELTPIPTVPCSECGKVFVSYRSLARHFRCHKKPMLYSCDSCPKTFKTRSSVLSHANVHRKEGRYTCSVCPAKFSWRNTLRTHLLSHERRLDDPLICLVCTKKFWYQQTWDQHVAIGCCRKRDKLAKQATYQCDICQRIQTTRGNLKKHLAMHQGLKPFVCDTCGARFTAQTSLNEHVHRHSGKRPFVCHVCGKSFAQSSGFRQHLAIHNRADQFFCEFCKKGFKLNRYLMKHIETMHIDDNKYNCHHCGKLFKLGEYLRRHMKAVHSETENMAEKLEQKPGIKSDGLGDVTEKVCEGLRSGGELLDRSEDEMGAEDSLGFIENNSVYEKEDGEVNCKGATGRNLPVAKEKVIEKGLVSRPILIEAFCKDIKPAAETPEKETVFASTDMASENVAEQTFEWMCGVPTVQPWDKGTKTKFGHTGSDHRILDICDVTVDEEVEAPQAISKGLCSDTLSGLQVRFLVSEPDEANILVDDKRPKKSQPGSRQIVRPFPCAVCSKSFSKQTTLDSHMGSHSMDRPVECDVCLHRFNTKQEVQRHLESHGVNSADELRCSACGKLHLRLADRKRHICGTTRTYDCVRCDAEFVRRSLLHSHVAEHHKASLECKICGKSSTTASNLKKHMAVHTGEKPFVCEVCGARFTANQSLKTHAGLHDGQRPFVCSVCAKTFAQKSSLTQHEMLHDREPRFACTFCDKRFKVASYLCRHIAVLHTAEKRFGCADCGKRYGLRSALAIHEQTHRERWRFQCEDCDKTFCDKRYMRRHSKKEHGMDLQ